MKCADPRPEGAYPPGVDVAQACLQASHSLRRHIRRQLRLPAHDQRIGQATSQLLDAISLAFTDDPNSLPRPVIGAALRLARHIASLPPTPYITPGAPDSGAPR